MMRHILRPGDTIPLSNLMTWVVSRDAEKTWEVVVKEYSKNKSQEQLGLYWGAWIPAIQKWLEDAKGVFLTAEDISEWLKDEYLDAKLVEIDGRTKKLRKSISHLKVKEMAEYMDRVDRHCAERGLVLPAPDYSSME